MKYFCPWCDLELTSNQKGAGHINEIEAWGRSECEYTVGSQSRFEPDKTYIPISETKRNEEILKDLILHRRRINKRILIVKRELGIIE